MYRELLQCDVKKMEYDFEQRIGRFYFKDDGCCDMLGAIEEMQAVDIDVQLIETFNDRGPDTSYAIEGDHWVSMMANGMKTHTDIKRGIGIFNGKPE